MDDGRLELEHGDVAGQTPLRVVKSGRGLGRRAASGRPLGGTSASRLVALRGVDDRRVEDDVVRQQTVQHLRELVRDDDPMPGSITFLITVPPCGRSMQRSAYPRSPGQGSHR
jgi:hypothetical protein